MNVLDLMHALNGEILANKARAEYKDKVVILGRLVGHDWEPTDIARIISAEVNTSKAAKPKKPQAQAALKADVVADAELAVSIDDLLVDDVPTLVKPKRKVRAK